MSYIKNTAFNLRVSNHENERTANITGVFYNGDTAETCSAGILCVRGDRLQNGGLPTGYLNVNAYKMKAAASTDTKGIYACNPHGDMMLEDPITGVFRKIGSNTLGVPQYAGIPDTYTKIDFDGGDKIYQFGAGDINDTFATGDIACVLDAGGRMKFADATAVAALTAGTPYFEIVGSGNFVQGAYDGFAYYDLLATRK